MSFYFIFNFKNYDLNYIKKIIKSLSLYFYFLFALLSQNAKSNKDEILNYSTEDHRLHIKGQTFNTKGKFMM